MMRRTLHDERGQAMTEFAVALPILMTIVFVIVQAGVALNHYLTLTDAVRAGARTASVTHNTATATDAVSKAADGLSFTTGYPQVNTPDGWVAGKDVTVTAKVPYSIDILGVHLLGGDLTSSTTQRIE